MKTIIEKGPSINEAFDVNTAQAHAYFGEVKQWISSQNEGLINLDLKAKAFGDQSLAFRTILKFIESERIIADLKEDVYLTLINPVYKENGRMQRREDHPHGENSLRTKIACINYFHTVNPKFNGRVIVVDDECPEGSGEMAQKILTEFPDSLHEVYFLGRAIDDNDLDLPSGVTHKDGLNRSVKGGAALFGMKKALKKEVEGTHIIVDNDADLSVHPMQLGLLVKDIIEGNAAAVAGSRREEDSVSLIGASRNQRGGLFIQIWQHFLPQLAQQITDTNRAFKAFESKALEQILPNIKIYTFPYQIELLQACISMGIPLEKRSIAYLDSEAASTQDGTNITETYLNQINQIIDISQRYDTISDSDPLLQYFSTISEEEWREIEANPPENLMDLLNS